jgi:drug/metabolite transporter (DMT)-like permease
LRVTTSNFLRTLPLVLLLCVFAYDVLSISGHGALLAVGSGAVASGIGYAVWYAALRGLTAARASIIQLAVPVIAALGGVIFLLEEITVRLVFSAVMILGGVAIALVSRRQ